MRDRDYYEMDFFKYPGISYKELEPHRGFAAFVTAKGLGGPQHDVRFLYTDLGVCVGLALVAKSKRCLAGKESPFVILGHIDVNCDGEGLDADRYPSATEILLGKCRGFSELHAYVVNGDDEPRLLGSVIEDLEKNKISFDLVIGVREERLAIDLVDGLPVLPSSLNGSAQYQPCRRLDSIYHDHLYGREDSIARAYDLMRGQIPEGYSRVGPEAPTKEEIFAVLAKQFGGDCASMMLEGDKLPKPASASATPSRYKENRIKPIERIPVISIETMRYGNGWTFARGENADRHFPLHRPAP